MRSAILLLNSNDSTIQGNEFHNLSSNGVEILSASSRNKVLNNFFGVDKSGAVPSGTRGNLKIGNPATSITVQENVFAGLSTDAIDIGRVLGTAQGGGHQVLGNIIGLDNTGSLASELHDWRDLPNSRKRHRWKQGLRS
jgi:hypothetical protein